MRKIIHVDMDCFFAAIEMRDHPELRDKPIAVGGSPQSRGVLCTSNYVARQYGVRSAMSSAYALRLCPQLIILPTNSQKYREAAHIIRAIFFEYTDLVEPLSMDEAFLDVTACQRCDNHATRMAQEIREKIYAQTKLTASAGIAPNKFLAKIASDLNKPNGQYVIKPHQISEFVYSLPVKKIFGVGKVTAEKLANHGVTTCGELQGKNPQELTELLGKFGLTLQRLCRGIDERPVEPARIRKSVSVENTYPKDLTDLTTCIAKLPDLLAQLQKRLVNNKRQIHKQFVKIKFADFVSTTAETISANLSLDIFQDLLKIGFQRKSLPVRLLGIGVAFKIEQTQTQYELEI